MGKIVFWTIIRAALAIPVLWILLGKIEYNYWFWLGLLTIGGIIIYPATIQYRLFIEENKEIIENTLCSSCKYFDASAVICLKYDQHPSEDYLPCEGVDWEPGERNEN